MTGMLSKVVAQKRATRRKPAAVPAPASPASPLHHNGNRVKPLLQAHLNNNNNNNLLHHNSHHPLGSVLQVNGDTEKRAARGNVRNGHAAVESHKITEFFPVRRSERKTSKQIEEEESAALCDAIQSGSAEKELYVFTCAEKGRGCRATRPYHKNEFVVEYKGDMIEYAEAKRREVEYSQDPSIGSYMYFFKHRNKKWCVDATKESPYKGRLVNHSALRPNLKTKVVEFGGWHHLILVARRDIEEGEELLYDYGDRTAATIALNPWLINS